MKKKKEDRRKNFGLYLWMEDGGKGNGSGRK